MKKTNSFIALLLASMMLLGSLASCRVPSEEEEDTTANQSQTEQNDSSSDDEGEEKTNATTAVNTESQKPEGGDGTAPVDSEGTSPEGSESKAPEGSEVTSPESEETVVWPEGGEETLPGLIEGDDAENIEYANQLANKVQGGYSDVDRTNYQIVNDNMILNYNTSIGSPQLVTSFTDKQGRPYVNGTMDVFVKMKDGNVYYSSGSIVGASTNIYRLGYYYYENRIEGQVFASATEGAKIKDVSLNIEQSACSDVEIVEREKDRIRFMITNRKDPCVVMRGVKFSASEYNYLQITLKCHSGVGANAELFIKAGGAGNFTANQKVDFLVTSDGQYHTYTIPLFGVQNYSGNVTGVRIDINGAPGSYFEISEIKALGLKEGTPDSLSLNRSFHAYSNKLHHVIQVAAAKDTENIQSVGMVTRIAADTVQSFVIRDRQGIHYDMEKIAWNTVGYVGFLIKGVGVFGYMLPYDGEGGTIRVRLEDGFYVIEQTKVPNGYQILTSDAGTNNANDFFMGQRIYNDNESDFAKFIYEAENEINPLTEKNFIINPIKSGGAKFKGYDSLRGCYRFDVDAAAGFRGPYSEYPNRHFGVEFEVIGDDRDRRIYVMTYTPQGSLECAAVLDEQRMMLPIPVEVAKNFLGDGENTIFMKDDAQYGETFIPLIVRANSKDKFTILNLYQNWGRFALKQISSIQYFSPYYHLSYGTTETNCLVPFGSGGLGLPDFRTMSAPIWSYINPQHNSCGSHGFVKYTDSDGVYVSNQMSGALIDSYGPTYADMSIEFLSDDGKMKITYSHMEQPHHDENRSFFTLKIEVVEDVYINNFKEDFYFYSVKPNDPTGVYQRLGYLDINNESQVVAGNKSEEVVEYVLGDNAPYFSFFDMDGYSAQFNRDANAVEGKGYANVAMIIGDSKFIIGGEEVKDTHFVLRDMNNLLNLTLDRGETHLKAGDSLTFSGILLPWGSQELENQYDEVTGELLDRTAEGKYFYDTVINPVTGEKYQDKNVRDVREDSILNPLKATAVDGCTVVRKSVCAALPELQSNDGKSATFTLSGGASNNAVRIYGFDTLTVPKIEEKIGDEWVPYEISSIENRDRLGYGYTYDGYNVFYDGDGTYSYSFVVNMDNGARTFRIVVDGEFEGWGEEKDPTEDLPMNFYVTPDNMADLGATLGQLYGCTSEFVEENGEKFFRFYGDNQLEAYLIPYNESPLYPTTGQYFVFKYRVPLSNTSSTSYFDFFASTSTTSFTTDGVSLRANSAVKKDGQWHTIIVDLSVIEKFTPNEKGEYIAKYVRVDILNSSAKIPATDYIDVAYFGMTDDLSKVLAISGDEDYVYLYEESTLKKVNVESGEKSEDKDPINVYQDPYEILTQVTGGVKLELSADKKYTTFYAKGSAEGHIFAYRNGSASRITGQYFVIKYRIPEGVDMATNFQIFASTQNPEPAEGSEFSVGVVKSNDWQILVLDLSRISTFNSVDGVYKAKHVRIDVINGKYTHSDENPSYIEVEYMGLHDSLEGILALNSDATFITFVNNEGKTERLTPEGEEYVPESEKGIIMITPDALANKKPSGCVATVENEGEFIRYTANNSTEGYLTVYQNATGRETGKYAFIRFRIPTSVNMFTDIEIHSSTQNAVPNGVDRLQIGSISKKDEWQLLIIDLSRITTFTAKDGKYNANYIRLDIINGKIDSTADAPAYIDVAYIGINNSIVEILALNSDIENAVYVDAKGKHNKIPTDGSFEEPGEEKDRDEGDPLKVYATPDEMEDLRVRSLDKAISADGTYFTYTAKGAGEASVFVYENAAGLKATGRYFVFKYRVPTGSADMPQNIEIFASTTNQGETAGDNMQIGNFISDGEWHVMVIDMAVLPTFVENNSEYFTKYIRLDIVNGKRDNTAWIDVAYFGIHDSLDEIYALNSDMESLYLVSELTALSGSPVGKGETVILGKQ